MAGVDALTEAELDEEQARQRFGHADAASYDYGSYGGVTLEECMAGVDALTEAELDEKEARQRFGRDEEEETEEMRLAAAVERRVAEEMAQEQRRSTGDGGGQFGNLIDVSDGRQEEEGFASWGDDSPGQSQASQQGQTPTEMGDFLAAFGAEDCELGFAARGYSTVADLAAAQLTEAELQQLGVRGYGVKGMVSALRKHRSAFATHGAGPTMGGAKPSPAPAPAPVPKSDGLLDVLEWS
jgi:hypothetical protein